jgi:long-chain acyl-CoA synthetase
MARRTLLDFFDDLARIDRDFVVYDDGYRVRTFSYRNVTGMARAFAARLRTAGIGPDQKVVLWSENCAEWLAVLWSCLLEGVVLVPVDYRSSADLVFRIADIVDAKAIVVGETVAAPEPTRPVWPIQSSNVSLQPSAFDPQPSAFDLQPSTIAEIIFTSGATADPKGVVLTHRNILANVVPIEREILKYKKYARPFAPIRISRHQSFVQKAIAARENRRG